MAKKIEFNKEVIKKYLFWVGTPIGLVVAVLAGWMAIGSVADELTKQKETLENQKSQMSRLRGEAATHPNQGTIDAVNQERDKLATNVLAAWETLVQEQQKRNQWTGLAQDVEDDIVSKNFLDTTLRGTTLSGYARDARRAIDGDGTPAHRGLLEDSGIMRVQQFGQNGQPIEKIILTANRGASVGMSGTGQSTPSGSPMVRPNAGPTTQKGKVVWASPEDLNFTIKDWGRPPLPFEVWLTQEDLWVYRALLWVIAESNKDVREAQKLIQPGAPGGGSGVGAGAISDPLNLHDSVVKEIHNLTIGQKAAMELAKQSARRINRAGAGMSDSSFGSASDYSDSSGSSPSFGSFGSIGSSSSDSGSSGGPALTGVAAAEAASKMALAGRYVDAEGTPLMEPDLTGQFRRMPIYLNLRVDQRFISDVLVNCANCPMPIDVLWVIVNPDATQNFAPASVSGAGGLSSGLSSGTTGSRRGSGGMTSSGGSQSRGSSNIDFGPNEITIEIYGVINIFSPPDPKKIGNET